MKTKKKLNCTIKNRSRGVLLLAPFLQCKLVYCTIRIVKYKHVCKEFSHYIYILELHNEELNDLY